MSIPAAQYRDKPNLLVLASTFPRWECDPEPAFVFELARRMTDQFHVTVLCPHAPGAKPAECREELQIIRYRYAPEFLETLVNDGGIVTNLRNSPWKALLVPGFLLSQAWWIWRLTRNDRMAVIHAHWLIPQGVAAILACAIGRRKKLPIIVTSHGADLFALHSRLMQWLKRSVFRRVAAATIVSDGMREKSLALGVAPGKLHLAPMGVDLSNRFTIDRTVVRSQNEILFVGRLVEKKGLIHLIQAMPAIIESNHQARLTVAGFGPELGKCRLLAMQLGISDRVHFLGAIEQVDLPRLYRRAAVFVAPFVEAAGGDQEGLGLVSIEALGCGCPVVVSEMAATKALADLSESIMVCRWNSPDELATFVLEGMKRGTGEQTDSLRSFDWPARAAAYIALLQSSMERR